VSRLPDDLLPPAVPPSADTELVARMAAGEADALGVLYDRHGASAYALAQAIVREPGDASRTSPRPSAVGRPRMVSAPSPAGR
jgi:hypothetical protein